MTARLLTTSYRSFNSKGKVQEESMAGKKKSSTRYGKAAGKTVASAMRRKKKGTLRSGKGGKRGKKALKSRRKKRPRGHRFAKLPSRPMVKRSSTRVLYVAIAANIAIALSK